MKIVTLIDYNPITGSLYGYGIKEIQETRPVSLTNNTKRYQQMIYTKRNMIIINNRTRHK
jgi:hypothetical protein